MNTYKHTIPHTYSFEQHAIIPWTLSMRMKYGRSSEQREIRRKQKEK